MIAFIRGEIAQIEEDGLVIENNGMGLFVLAPLAMMQPLPPLGGAVFLHTHLQIREDAWQLFGFPEKEQLTVFRYLLAVSGVGAKTALALLNTLSIRQIANALAQNNPDAFCSAPGIGKKTAQRLVLELRDKMREWAEPLDAPTASAPMAAAALDEDALSALRQLGFLATEARSLVLDATRQLGETATSDELLKEALRLAARL